MKSRVCTTSACGWTISTSSEKTVTASGGRYLHGREDRNPNTFYEVKYRDPDGIVFDITPTGWRGAVKEVVPAESAKEAAE